MYFIKMCRNKKKKDKECKCKCVIERPRRKKKEPIDKIFFRPEKHLNDYSKSLGTLLEESKYKTFVKR
jgi:hypothetical protein